MKILEMAVPGFYLDGRARPETRPDGRPSLPPHTTVCLVECTGKGDGYHKPGDRWVEYFDSRRM